MEGVICKRDILAHPIVTIRCFGWKVFYRALFAGPHQTFLSLLADTLPSERHVNVPEILGRCADLELHLARVYQQLARHFSAMGPTSDFFDTLARQEQNHASLLEIAKMASARQHWEERQFDPWQDVVPEVARLLHETEARLSSVDTLAVTDALRLVIGIESSEINQLFLGVLTATDSPFVKKLRVFSDALRDHFSYIGRCIPVLEPSLTEACHKIAKDSFRVGGPVRKG
jgi:hypothetical protein